jgi:hypothetical protein
MSLAYDPNKPEYGPNTPSANERDFLMSQMNGDPYGNDDDGGGGGGGDGCGGIIVFGIIALTAMSLFESAFKGFKSRSRSIAPTEPAKQVETVKIHYLALQGPLVLWHKKLNRTPSRSTTSVTIENNSNSAYLIYSFRNQGSNTRPGPMFREATVNAKKTLRIDCNVGQVFVVVHEASGRLSGAVTAESRPGVLPFW